MSNRWWLRLVCYALLHLCMGGCGPRRESISGLASDWQGAAAPDGSRAYVIDWACEPKRFGGSAEEDISHQEEYCEWRSVATMLNTNAKEKVCQFTSSFDHTRDFYLNSRGRTGINSIGAAQQLRDDCSAVATRHLKRGQAVGHNCSEVGGVGGGCVAERNSDPEICDKVRFVVGQKYYGKFNFCIDQMPPDYANSSSLPLMRLGMLTSLPKGCVYSQADHTEVSCRVAEDLSCFALSGQLRVGIRVLTTVVKAVGEDTPLGLAVVAPEGAVQHAAKQKE